MTKKALNHVDLGVYRSSFDVAMEIFQLSKSFPKEERYSLVDQMRRLPSYQINWPTVRDIMRDMEDKYLFLRRVAQKCLAHVTNDDSRRELHRLISHCDRKIDQCHSLGD